MRRDSNSSNKAVKNSEYFEHTAIKSGTFFICKKQSNIVLCVAYASLLLWSFSVFNYRIILHICNTWALQLSLSFLEQMPIWRAESPSTVSSQRPGSEQTAPSRVEHIHCCLLGSLQKWGTIGLDPARCSRNLHLPLWAQRSSHSQYEELQLVSAGIAGLLCLPCTYHSFANQVWGQHNGNYSSWTIWLSTSQENLISAEVCCSTSGSDTPFTVLGLEDILIPALLVAYSHRFDIQAHSSQVHLVSSTAAYGCGLLASFAVQQ